MYIEVGVSFTKSLKITFSFDKIEYVERFVYSIAREGNWGKSSEIVTIEYQLSIVNCQRRSLVDFSPPTDVSNGWLIDVEGTSLKLRVNGERM